MEETINSNLLPIERSPLPEMVAKSLIDLIQNGHLKVGDKLPSQRELEEMLNVSRPSIREALSGLIMLGYIEVRAGQGYYVHNVKIKKDLNFSPNLEKDSKDTFRYILQARCAIEPYISGIAASKAEPEDIKKLYEVCEIITKIENAFSSIEIIEAGLDFHQAVADATHNPVLSEIERVIIFLLRQHFPKAFSVPVNYDTNDGPSHLAILHKIEAKDVNGVQLVVIEHLKVFLKQAGVDDIWE